MKIFQLHSLPIDRLSTSLLDLPHSCLTLDVHLVDIMLGTPLSLPKSHSLPEFVATMRQRMSTVFSSVRESAQGQQKQVYDRGSRASTYDIGDHMHVWLYVPAVRVGSTKKFASLYGEVHTL